MAPGYVHVLYSMTWPSIDGSLCCWVCACFVCVWVFATSLPYVFVPSHKYPRVLPNTVWCMRSCTMRGQPLFHEMCTGSYMHDYRHVITTLFVRVCVHNNFGCMCGLHVQWKPVLLTSLCVCVCVCVCVCACARVCDYYTSTGMCT